MNLATDIFSEALEYFQTLLRFDTTNPPGNEREAIHYISNVLKKEGLEPIVIESAEKRANLIVRIKGDGSEKPLLITSHIDVVGTEPDKWKYPPFAATIAEDYIWGRGAIDMKNMTTYCLSTMVALARKKTKLKRDVIMSVVADEEVGGDYGMGFLTKNYADLLRAEYALGELGGYTIHMKGQRIYPIQIAEKGIFWINVKFRGSPGHGSIPKEDNAHFQAARFISKLQGRELPSHLTNPSKLFFTKLTSVFGPLGGIPFKLMQTSSGPRILRMMELNSRDPDRYAALKAMLVNTVNPTGIESGRQHNVVPSTVTLKLDCRLLPGFTGKDLILELEKFVGHSFEYEIVREDLGHESEINTPLFKMIEKQIVDFDPGAHAVPILTVGFTDAQYLKKLGMNCYGFTPIKLPPDISFPTLYHGHNERIPVEGFRWGLNVFMQTVFDFCSQS